MKKFVYSLAVILPAIMLISSSDALAQRKNTTEKDVVPAYAAEQDYQYDGSNEPMQKKMHKKCTINTTRKTAKSLTAAVTTELKTAANAPRAKMRQRLYENRMNEKTKDINEEYNTAIKRLTSPALLRNKKNCLSNRLAKTETWRWNK